MIVPIGPCDKPGGVGGPAALGLIDADGRPTLQWWQCSSRRTICRHVRGQRRANGMSGDTYDKDIVLWSEHQATLLRRVAAGERLNDQVDWENVAEEIESLGRSERTSLASHVRNVLEHLIKLQCSPASLPRAGWRASVVRARAEIAALLEESPSLRQRVDGVIASELPRARMIAAATLEDYGESPRVELDQLRYDSDQVLGPWLPEQD